MYWKLRDSSNGGNGCKSMYYDLRNSKAGQTVYSVSFHDIFIVWISFINVTKSKKYILKDQKLSEQKGPLVTQAKLWLVPSQHQRGTNPSVVARLCCPALKTTGDE